LSGYQGVKDYYFAEEVKLEEVAKIMKFAQALVGPIQLNNQG
jgi:hypothetical protein